MKRALVLLAFLVLAAGARADDGTKLPWNPWENATAGDWETLTVDVKWDHPGPPPHILDLVTYRLKGVDENEVKVAFELVPDLMPDKVALIFSRTVVPTFEQLLNVKGSVSDVKVTADKLTIGGREFACTKVSCVALSNAQPGAKVENEYWFSRDVKGFGLVAMVTVVPMAKGGKTTLTYHVGGFGSKDKVEWGKKPEELAPKKTGDAPGK